MFGAPLAVYQLIDFVMGLKTTIWNSDFTTPTLIEIVIMLTSFCVMTGLLYAQRRETEIGNIRENARHNFPLVTSILALLLIGVFFFELRWSQRIHASTITVIKQMQKLLSHNLILATLQCATFGPFLHSSVGHITQNIIALMIYGTIVEKTFGRLKMVLLYFFSGFCGVLTQAVVHYFTGTLVINQLGVGASGAMYSLIGVGLVTVLFSKSVSIGSKSVFYWFAAQNILAILHIFCNVQRYFTHSDTHVADDIHFYGLVIGCFAGAAYAIFIHFRKNGQSLSQVIEHLFMEPQ